MDVFWIIQVLQEQSQCQLKLIQMKSLHYGEFSYICQYVIKLLDWYLFLFSPGIGLRMSY